MAARVGDDTAYRPVLAPEHRRPETNTFVTYPEWLIVHVYEGYAAVSRSRGEAAFPYFSGNQATPEDVFARSVAEDYAVFLVQTPIVILDEGFVRFYCSRCGRFKFGECLGGSLPRGVRIVASQAGHQERQGTDLSSDARHRDRAAAGQWLRAEAHAGTKFRQRLCSG